jgi:hypothetical protein
MHLWVNAPPVEVKVDHSIPESTLGRVMLKRRMNL